MTWEYSNIDCAWTCLLEALLARPTTNSRLGLCKEILAYQLRLRNVNQTFLLNPRRKLSPHYACAELLWYLMPTKNTAMIEAYAPQYAKFAEKGEAHGAYGYRIFGEINQLQAVIELLRHDPDTRQAVVLIWKWDDLAVSGMGGCKDVPCTLSLQFLVRDRCLHLMATMRSNDVWLGLPYDVFAFTCLQRLVAHAVGVTPGWYVHQAGSEHLYEKNWQAAEEAILSTHSCNRRRLEHEWDESLWHGDSWVSCVKEATKLEQYARKTDYHQAYVGFVSTLPDKTFLSDAVYVCADKWGWPTRGTIHSPVLKEALRC